MSSLVTVKEQALEVNAQLVQQQKNDEEKAQLLQQQNIDKEKAYLVQQQKNDQEKAQLVQQQQKVEAKIRQHRCSQIGALIKDLDGSNEHGQQLLKMLESCKPQKSEPYDWLGALNKTECGRHLIMCIFALGNPQVSAELVKSPAEVLEDKVQQRKFFNKDKQDELKEQEKQLKKLKDKKKDIVQDQIELLRELQADIKRLTDIISKANKRVSCTYDDIQKKDVKSVFQHTCLAGYYNREKIASLFVCYRNLLEHMNKIPSQIVEKIDPITNKPIKIEEQKFKAPAELYRYFQENGFELDEVCQNFLQLYSDARKNKNFPEYQQLTVLEKDIAYWRARSILNEKQRKENPVDETLKDQYLLQQFSHLIDLLKEPNKNIREQSRRNQEQSRRNKEQSRTKNFIDWCNEYRPEEERPREQDWRVMLDGPFILHMMNIKIDDGTLEQKFIDVAYNNGLLDGQYINKKRGFFNIQQIKAGIINKALKKNVDNLRTDQIKYWVNHLKHRETMFKKEGGLYFQNSEEIIWYIKKFSPNFFVDLHQILKKYKDRDPQLKELYEDIQSMR